MPKWYERANGSSFKAVEGGYVFQMPSPWVLARPSYYLVNEAKKADILTYLRRWRLMMLLISGAMPFAMLLGSLWPDLGRSLLPAFLALGAGLFSLSVFIAAMLLMAAIIAVPQVYLARSLRPLLADAPQTEQRIEIAEQLPNIAKSASGTVLIVGLIATLIVIGSGGAELVDAYFEGHLVHSAFAFSPLILFAMLLGSYFIYLLRLKIKMQPTSPEFRA